MGETACYFKSVLRATAPNQDKSVAEGVLELGESGEGEEHTGKGTFHICAA
jgi:hypothetical protein